ncbi:hypothetical protein Glove_173g61 [Diversispora epigaea]|uniref:Protein kinase domain-containing protein n=1 Tax=Diversispora epigaea TaxID=1348612 RepID=A0A397IVG8_9GLOM|nr:hypothetical protein Glove_173g61 [Diversispora epigaea]
MTEVCPECNQKYERWWCKPCNSTRLKNEFDKWTSGNDKIDKFIQDTKLAANTAKGGYGTIYYANWVDGHIGYRDDEHIDYWDIENQQWKRNNNFKVMAILLKANGDMSSTTFFGITKDLETREFMIVLRYFEGGSLGNYLNNNFNNINWFFKLYHLYHLANEFSKIHKLDIVHRDFHPGNILKYNLGDYSTIYISDFGLILIGEEYTKPADVYSFAFVAYEIITGIPPYHDLSHDKDLALKICNGFRPKIPFHTPKLISRIIMRCWDARITYRPTFEELEKELFGYRRDWSNEITIQIKEAEEFQKSNN